MAVLHRINLEAKESMKRDMEFTQVVNMIKVNALCMHYRISSDLCLSTQ